MEKVAPEICQKIEYTRVHVYGAPEKKINNFFPNIVKNCN